ncbi:MAG TPA: hypothetical protein VFZ89_02685 [Solirubrobacteraceae bacterium]
MTHASCPDCGLRFSAAVAHQTTSCPMCCAPLQLDVPASQLLGHQLYFEPPAHLELDRPTEDGRWPAR